MGKTYKPEFKTQALDVLASVKGNMALAGKKVGVYPETLKKWALLERPDIELHLRGQRQPDTYMPPLPRPVEPRQRTPTEFRRDQANAEREQPVRPWYERSSPEPLPAGATWRLINEGTSMEVPYRPQDWDQPPPPRAARPRDLT